KTGERTYCIIAEWVDMDALVKARPIMISTLNSFRDTLEDLGGGLGVTDPGLGSGRIGTIWGLRHRQQLTPRSWHAIVEGFSPLLSCLPVRGGVLGHDSRSGRAEFSRDSFGLFDTPFHAVCGLITSRLQQFCLGY